MCSHCEYDSTQWSTQCLQSVISLLACSHCRRDETGQFCTVSNCVHTSDKTVLSRLDPVLVSPRWWCEHNWNAIKLSCLVELAVWTQLQTRQDSFVWSPVVFTTPTWQDKTVLSRLRRRCEQASRLLSTFLSVPMQLSGMLNSTYSLNSVCAFSCSFVVVCCSVLVFSWSLIITYENGYPTS